MILSIRHRILMPFLFITVFMTFSGMFIAVEFVKIITRISSVIWLKHNNLNWKGMLTKLFPTNTFNGVKGLLRKRYIL